MTLRAQQADRSRDHPQTVPHHPVKKRISSGHSPLSWCHLMTEKTKMTGGAGMVRRLHCLHSCVILFTFTVKHNSLYLSTSQANLVRFLPNNNITNREQISPRVNGFLREAKLIFFPLSFLFAFIFFPSIFFISSPFLCFTFPCVAMLRYALQCYSTARPVVCYTMLHYTML